MIIITIIHFLHTKLTTCINKVTNLYSCETRNTSSQEVTNSSVFLLSNQRGVLPVEEPLSNELQENRLKAFQWGGGSVKDTHHFKNRQLLGDVLKELLNHTNVSCVCVCARGGGIISEFKSPLPPLKSSLHC